MSKASDLAGTPGAPPEIPLTPGLRRFLYGTAATTGGSIMIIEILGAKMLAPYVGTSHFVWTAQIAVTLLALSVGYYLGGRLVDRSTRLSRLYLCILAAAVYLAASIGVVEPVALWCLGFRLAAGSLLASAFLYFVPLALLAMVGPFLVRVFTTAVRDVGTNTGRLTAVSTIGSLLGTVLIGYVLLPYLRNSVTMFLTAAVLTALVATYFLVWARKEGSQAVGVAMVAVLLAGTYGVKGDAKTGFDVAQQVFRANSNFGQLQVVEYAQGTRRVFLNDFLPQNNYAPAEKQSLSPFTYMLEALARSFAPKLDRALCIGMGVGIVPMSLARQGVKVDVVEINPEIVPLAERFFDFDPSLVSLKIGDGRSFLSEAEPAAYDAVVLDAFLGDSTPSHLMTKEAFAAVHRALAPEGVLVINSFGQLAQGKDFFMASLDKTLKSVFASVAIYGSAGGNIYFVASDRTPLTALRRPDFSKVHPQLKPVCEQAWEHVVTTRPTSGIVLTDDFNPVEFYDALNREEWRQGLVRSVQKM